MATKKRIPDESDTQPPSDANEPTVRAPSVTLPSPRLAVLEAEERMSYRVLGVALLEEAYRIIHVPGTLKTLFEDWAAHYYELEAHKAGLDAARNVE
jgi:hypothetical protein